MKLLLSVIITVSAWGQVPSSRVLTNSNIPDTRTFTDQGLTVYLHSVGGAIIPIIDLSNYPLGDADSLMLRVFYKTTITMELGEKPTPQRVVILKSREVRCPAWDGAVGCDDIKGVDLSLVSYVSLQFFKTTTKFDIGRPADPLK